MDDTTLSREELDAGWRDMKYLVGFNEKTKTFAIDFTRTWYLHDSIPKVWPDGHKPISGGYFKAKLGDRSQGMKWDLSTLEVFGRSRGYNFGPHQRDTELVRKMLEGENGHDYLRLFNEALQPVES